MQALLLVMHYFVGKLSLAH